MFAYIVRCNFTEPSREAEWNAWYSGPKIAQMLDKPHFCSCQRFKRIAGSGRDYLALWMVQTPEAFATKQYRSDWGFFDWETYVTDWSRDLFDAGALTQDAFAVAPDGALEVMSFDGKSAAEARAARAAMAPADEMLWLPIAGLDRHTPLIGLRPSATGSASTNSEPAPGAQWASYRPICDFHRAAPL